MCTSGAGSGETSITASPIVFTSRTGGSTSSPASRDEAVGDAAELLGRDLLAQAREADEVREGDDDLARAAQRPLGPLGGADGLGAHHVLQVQPQHVLDHRAE